MVTLVRGQDAECDEPGANGPLATGPTGVEGAIGSR